MGIGGGGGGQAEGFRPFLLGLCGYGMSSPEPAEGRFRFLPSDCGRWVALLNVAGFQIHRLRQSSLEVSVFGLGASIRKLRAAGMPSLSQVVLKTQVEGSYRSPDAVGSRLQVLRSGAPSRPSSTRFYREPCRSLLGGLHGSTEPRRPERKRRLRV